MLSPRTQWVANASKTLGKLMLIASPWTTLHPPSWGLKATSHVTIVQ